MGREVKNQKGEYFTLTEDEEKYVRALERLSKMNPGRIQLMANGTISIRINGIWHNDSIDGHHKAFSIQCEGGDGGDNY
jgi:hypothetical protein